MRGNSSSFQEKGSSRDGKGGIKAFRIGRSAKLDQTAFCFYGHQPCKRPLDDIAVKKLLVSASKAAKMVSDGNAISISIERQKMIQRSFWLLGWPNSERPLQENSCSWYYSQVEAKSLLLCFSQICLLFHFFPYPFSRSYGGEWPNSRKAGTKTGTAKRNVRDVSNEHRRSITALKELPPIHSHLQPLLGRHMNRQAGAIRPACINRQPLETLQSVARA